MSAPAQTAPRAPSPTAAPIVQAGKNCWRIDRAHQVFCIQDAADYFRLVRQALLSARDTVFILGWDIFAEVDLLPAGTTKSRRSRRRRRTHPQDSMNC